MKEEEDDDQEEEWKDEKMGLRDEFRRRKMGKEGKGGGCVKGRKLKSGIKELERKREQEIDEKNEKEEELQKEVMIKIMVKDGVRRENKGKEGDQGTSEKGERVRGQGSSEEQRMQEEAGKDI